MTENRGSNEVNFDRSNAVSVMEEEQREETGGRGEATLREEKQKKETRNALQTEEEKLQKWNGKIQEGNEKKRNSVTGRVLAIKRKTSAFSQSDRNCICG